jgi:hypothetical protein
MEKRSPDVNLEAFGYHAKALINYLKNISLTFLFSALKLLMAVNPKAFNYPKNYSL